VIISEPAAIIHVRLARRGVIVYDVLMKLIELREVQA